MSRQNSSARHTFSQTLVLGLCLILTAWLAGPSAALAQDEPNSDPIPDAAAWSELHAIPEGEDVPGVPVQPFQAQSASGAASPDAATIQIWIDRGCGATYPLGAPIRVYMRVSQSAVYTLRSETANGTNTLGSYGMQAGLTYWLSGQVGLPQGLHTLRLSGAGSQSSCGFQAGSSAPQPAGDITLIKQWSMDAYLRPTTCIPSGQRVYLGASVRNGRSTPATVSVVMMIQGSLSSYTVEHIETVTLQPGQSRDFHGFSDGLSDRTYKYKVMLISQAQEVDGGTTSFRVGGC